MNQNGATHVPHKRSPMVKSGFQLKNQRLISSHFEVNQAFRPDEQNKLEMHVQPRIKVQKHDTNREGIVKLYLEVFEKKNIDTIPFYIELEIVGLFIWSEDITEPDMFLNINAPAILFSYLRSIVLQLTVASGNPPLNLPLINFDASYKQRQKS